MPGTRDGVAAAATAANAKKSEKRIVRARNEMQFSFKDYNVPEGTHVERCL